MKDDRKAPRLHFAALLRKYREEGGHSNARAFFEAQGGRAFFGSTYRAYLDVEKGLSVPRPAMVERLVAALRIALDESKAKEFALAYLQTLLGLNSFLDFAAQTLAGDPPEKSLAPEDAEAAPTADQMRLLGADAGCYWCFAILSRDKGHWRAGELAPLLGVTDKEAERALADLEKAGLVCRDKSGKWFGLAAQNETRSAGPAELAALDLHWENMSAKRGGEVIHEHPALTRCSVSELREYFPYLTHGLLAADRLSRKEKGPDTGLFLFEVRVEKLLPY